MRGVNGLKTSSSSDDIELWFVLCAGEFCVCATACEKGVFFLTGAERDCDVGVTGVGVICSALEARPSTILQVFRLGLRSPMSAGVVGDRFTGRVDDLFNFSPLVIFAPMSLKLARRRLPDNCWASSLLSTSRRSIGHSLILCAKPQ
jgi:hypothetical protein